MFKTRFNTPCGLSILLALGISSPSLAQTPPPAAETLVEADLPTMVAVEDRLNAAGLCTPLQFDLRTITGLLGFPIPAFLPIDTNLRWDQSRHRVTRFASSPSKVELDFKLGCQPSTNGVALDFVGLSPDKVRLDDKVKCSGDRTQDGELGSLVCTVDGKIGRFLSKNIIGLSAKVGKLLPMNLAVQVVDPAVTAPSVGAAAPAPGGAAGSAAIASDTTGASPAGTSAPAEPGASVDAQAPASAGKPSATTQTPVSGATPVTGK